MMADEYGLTPIPHDPFEEKSQPNLLDPKVASYIASHTTQNEWEAPGLRWSVPDAANAANPPGPRIDATPDMSAIGRLQSSDEFDRNMRPDLQNDFARKLYEKGSLERWKEITGDQEFMDSLTDENRNNIFPVVPGVPVTPAGYTLTPVDHDPFEGSI